MKEPHGAARLHPRFTGGLTQHPADYAERAFAGVPEATIAKVLHDTPARLYGIP